MLFIIIVDFVCSNDYISHKVNSGKRILYSFYSNHIWVPYNRFINLNFGDYDELLDELKEAKEREDYLSVARINSEQANDAFKRSNAFLNAWLGLKDDDTDLFPWRPWDDEWLTRHVAGDLYPFMFLSAWYTQEESMPLLYNTLHDEKRISGKMPRDISLKNNSIIPQTNHEMIYGASEYVKDGLIILYEITGEDIWLDRIIDTMDAIIERSEIETTYGNIPSHNSEVNGEILESLSRLYFITEDEKYLNFSRNIGDFYFLKALPENNYYLCFEWDFELDRCGNNETVLLTDHANEVIPGLSELMIVEYSLDSDRFYTYKPVFLKMLDNLMENAHDGSGFWYRELNLIDRDKSNKKENDVWAYLTNAFYTGYVISGDEKYLELVNTTLINLPNYKRNNNFNLDSYADSVEGALYLLNKLPNDGGFEWVDEGIYEMFLIQKPSGFIGKGHLGGNFARTTLMYAMYKTQGAYINNWREDVLIGATSVDDTLYLYLSSEEDWNGMVFFDFERHKDYMNLPINYPRINSLSEWFVIDKDKKYEILNDETTIEVYGKELINGYSVNLSGDPLYLIIKPI